MNDKRNQDKNNDRKDNVSITPYSPFTWGLSTRFEDIFDEFKQSFDQLMTPFASFMEPYDSNRTIDTATRAPFVDMIDEGDHYRVNAELPGFTKDNVNIEVTKTDLILRAEKKAENEDRGENYLRRERGYSSLERRLSFPEDVIPEKAEGTLNNGVLELKVPKLEVKPKERSQRVQLK